MSRRSRVLVRVVLLFACVLIGSQRIMAQDPVGVIEVQASGPLDGFECGVGWELTQVELEQQSGESALLRVPLIGRRNPGAHPGQPELGEGTSGVELLRATLEWPRAWRELPRSLQSRSLPPVERAAPQIGSSQWAWLAMSLILVLALRRRPWLGLLVGAISAGLLYSVIPSSQLAQPTMVTVFEGTGDGHWLEVRGAQDRLLIDHTQTGWLSRLPATPHGTHVELLAAERGAWAICSEGTRLFFSTETRLASVPSPSGPGQHRFQQVWVRLPGEGWSLRGPWSADEPLPAAQEGVSTPPGWLAAGLPQGRPILVGRLESGADQPTWMRLIGFE